MFNGSGGLLDVVLFAIFAIFIASKLFEVLGKKDYDEDNFNKKGNKDNKNIIVFPQNKANKNNVNSSSKPALLNNLAHDAYEEKYGKEIAGQISKIKSIDSSFSIEEFISGAGVAFEMILKAFANQDKETLKNLLNKEVCEEFILSIDERIKLGNKLDTTIISILPIEIQNISVKRRNVAITVLIKSEQVNLVKDSDDNIIEGNPSKTEESVDIWTFSRNLSSQNPNWELVETR